MKIVEKLVEQFGPSSFRKGQMYFEYGQLYHIKDIHEGGIAYAPDGNWHTERQNLRQGQNFSIKYVTAKRTVFGHRIVFGLTLK